MASAKLRLKVQESSRPRHDAASIEPVARIWVDTGVPHLEPIYDYLVPSDLDSKIVLGVRVSVNFSGRVVDGFVIERTASSQSGELKFIEKVLSPVALLNAEVITLINATAGRWGGSVVDVATAAVPPRVATVEKTFNFSVTDNSSQKSKKGGSSHSYYLFTPSEDPFETMATWIGKRRSLGGVLIVLPEAREVALLQEVLIKRSIEHTILDASLPRSARYSNYLQVATGISQVVIGTRGAIFAPIQNLQTMVIYREGSQSHYEVRSPGWNTRDVAIIRSQISGIDLTFAGFSPSSEVSLLIERGFVTLSGKRAKMDASAFPQSYGELLPDRIFAPIRKALAKGSVLFLVPRKGYAHAVACKSCRNIALCQCGGKISQPSADSGFICSLCSAKSSTWSCAWCKSTQSVLLGRGNIRFAQEIGKAFPGFAIYTSDAEHPVKEIAEKHSLVLATAGMAPAIAGGYQAVVIIDGDGLFAQLDLRAQERARESIMQASSLCNPQGKICVVIDSSHPIVAALSRWNLSPLLSRELREREQALLPPYVRAITLDFEDSEVPTFITGINGAIRDGRLPSTARILGPNKFSPSQSRVILTVDQEGGQELADFVVTYRKKRATSKKSLPHMRIDPYSLTPSQS